MNLPNENNVPTPYDTYSPDDYEQQESSCEMCDRPILSGDEYYHVDGSDICLKCIRFFKKVAGEI